MFAGFSPRVTRPFPARGARAIAELKRAGRSHARQHAAHPKSIRIPIAFNVLPHVDTFLENGYTKEEMKMQNEGRRIMHLPDFQRLASPASACRFIGRIPSP